MKTQSTLVVVDAQREYLAEGRPFQLRGIGPSLENIRRLAAFARRERWCVIHVQHVQVGNVFAPGGEYSAFIAGLEPMEGETLITKSQLSAFTNPNMSFVLNQRKGDVYVAGYGSAMCCMATILSGAALGHKMTFVHDASWAVAREGLSEADMHRSACAVMGIHAQMRTTEACMNFEMGQLAA